MLADKQAALEKLEWEAKVSSTKVEELEVDVASMDVEISALMKVFRKITENSRASYPTERSDDSSLECEPVQLDVRYAFLFTFPKRVNIIFLHGLLDENLNELSLSE
jgi:hypothetical protein